MNLKLRAAAITVGVVGGGLAAGYALSFVPGWAVLALVLVFSLYLVYTTALAGLKYDQAIDEMNSKYNDK